MSPTHPRDDRIRALVELVRRIESHAGDPTAEDEAFIQCSLPALWGAACAFALSRFEIDLLALLLAVEATDVLASGESAPAGYPTVAWLFERLAIDDDRHPSALATLSPGAALRRWELIAIDGEGPTPTRRVRVPEGTWPLLLGLTRYDGDLAADVPDAKRLDHLVLDAATRACAMEIAAQLSKPATAETQIVAVCGEPGSGRTALARALAGRIGAPTVYVDAAEQHRDESTTALCRAIRWQGAASIIEGDTLDGELPRTILDGATDLVFWIAPKDARLPASRLRNAAFHALDLPWPGSALRAELWSHALRGARAPDVDPRHLGHHLRLGPGAIEDAVRIAQRRARQAAGVRPRIERGDLEEACRRVAAAPGTLIQRLDTEVDPTDLVVCPEVWSELELVMSWLEHSPKLLDEWELGRRLGIGRALVCLLHGPPGTGKTLAARVIARRAGLDLYRVDLSQVVDKYIGETEKNLRKLFAAAREANAILFCDEADAVFATRTHVKDHHDRNANRETGFLLQCIEEHEGCVILASNLRRSFDEAFSRRIHVVAELPLPGRGERRQIWDRHLPADRAADIDLDVLTEPFDLVGGDIRNAVLSAALLAASDGKPLGMRHALEGVRRELRKQGRSASRAPITR